MTLVNQQALARAREVLAGIREDEQDQKEMATMSPTKKKTRAGLVDAPPDVTPLRRAADEAVTELRDALDAVTAAGDRNAKLDRANPVDTSRFPAARRGDS